METHDIQVKLDRIKRRCKEDTLTGCLSWTGKKSDYRLPVSIHGIQYDARDLSWRVNGNTIPAGLVLKQTCAAGNPVCVNPMHLTLIPKRYRHRNTRLTSIQVKEITTLLAEKIPYREIGKRYEVSRQTVLNIARKKIRTINNA